MGIFSNLFGKKSAPAAPKSAPTPVPEPVPPELDDILREYIEESKLPCVNLTPKRRATTVFESKFGGAPYLPPDFSYPHSRMSNGDGAPLRLLAQLNFEELPKLPDFPETGILQFYIAEEDVMGLDFDDPTSGKGFRVVYHENIVRDEALLQVPPALEEDGIFPLEGELALEAEPATLPMPHQDFRFATRFMDIYKRHIPTEKKHFELPDEQMDEVYERLDDRDGWGHHIGGYAQFTQYDPRNAGRWEEHSVLLLQIDSKDSIMWGDSGVANFFITPQDLKQRDFSKVLYNWDCY